LEAAVSHESDPAPLAGFLSDPLVPAVTPFDPAGLLELDREWEHVTTPPSFSALTAFTGPETSDGSQSFLPPAPRVELAFSLQALEHHTRTGDRGAELRDFTGPAPVMELKLRPETGNEPAGADDVMEILMSPHPPQKAKPWLGVPHGFPAAPAELGDLARLDFATTGFAYSDGPVAVQQPAGAPPQVPVDAEPAPEAFVVPAEPVVPMQPPFAVEPVAGSDAAGSHVAEQAPPEPAVPELVTKVLPVTLHGLAATRGKLAPAFPSAIARASDVQIPPSATLPLRPMIVFGPPPTPARTPEAVVAPAKPQQAQPKEVQTKQVQARPAQPFPAQSQPTQPLPASAPEPAPARAKAEERVRSSVVPAPKPVPVKRQAAPEPAVPEKIERTPKAPAASAANPRPESRRESPAPKTSESAAASETAIPYNLQTTESAWSKLSSGVKIGIAAAAIVAISGIAYLVTRGNGKPAAEAPAAVSQTTTVASGVAISGGWIDDWANAAKSRRHISVLSGSAKLSDYRLEFQAQIESKAIGWIFRGLNPRNYYVTKLEVVTPGLEPTVALVHFAVVDGQDEDRVSVPLPMKVRIDTTYKIRFEAFGNHFTTWIQDQKIAEWTDNRLGSGGVGFFSERDEKAAMQGTVNVVPLVPKN